MNNKNFLIERLRKSGCMIETYAQNFEDLIIERLLKECCGNKKFRYVDIGANHPIRRNNTYLLYKNGGKGILVEPNPEMFSKILKVRENDICVMAGIVGEDVPNEYMTYYMFNDNTLNTFSNNSVKEVIGKGARLKSKEKVKIINIQDFEKAYLRKIGDRVDFLSIDVEGIDYEILQNWNYNICRPFSICIETVEYLKMKRNDFEEIVDFMKEKNYFIYADTWINTIFVDSIKYEKYLNRLTKKRRGTVLDCEV